MSQATKKQIKLERLKNQEEKKKFNYIPFVKYSK